MNKQKIVLWALLIAVMGGIFFFSSQTATESQKESDVVVYAVMDELDVNDPTNQGGKTMATYYSLNDLIRDGMHVLEFGVLGMILCLLLNQHKIKYKFVTGLVVCTAYAVTDEVHQLFIPGRGASVWDWFIDIIGGLTGILIAYLAIGIAELLKKRRCR